MTEITILVTCLDDETFQVVGIHVPNGATSRYLELKTIVTPTVAMETVSINPKPFGLTVVADVGKNTEPFGVV